MFIIVDISVDIFKFKEIFICIGLYMVILFKLVILFEIVVYENYWGGKFVFDSVIVFDIEDDNIRVFFL